MQKDTYFLVYKRRMDRALVVELLDELTEEQMAKEFEKRKRTLDEEQGGVIYIYAFAKGSAAKSA